MPVIAPWMTAADAAAALGVAPATIYAYVSRGLIRSQAVAGRSRHRGYAREDVESLRRRTASRRHPEEAAGKALQWGMPVLDSSITLIDGQGLFYRGLDATVLAESRSVEDVAALLWTGAFENASAIGAQSKGRRRRRRSATRSASFVARAQSALALASSHDALAFDRRPASVARCGRRILDGLTRVAAPRSSPRAAIDCRLAGAWGVSQRGTALIRAALILCADHELNVSSFTARAVASAGSSPYAVVIAGLAALEGTRHGGLSVRAEALLAAMRRTPQLRHALTARLRRGETLDGFGHPLYPQGDPRAMLLLARLRAAYPASAELGYVLRFAAAAAAATGDLPTVDFALAALARVLRLPVGTPLVIFAIGRTIGWIAHAIEQYGSGQLIRPRAKYVGVMAATAPRSDGLRRAPQA